MNFSLPDGSILQPHPRISFEFSPTPRTEIASESHNISDPTTDSYCFDFLDLADNLEIHKSISNFRNGP